MENNFLQNFNLRTQLKGKFLIFALGTHDGEFAGYVHPRGHDELEIPEGRCLK
ncbi:MAG: hypothetical protein ACXAB4_06625 [Candidatus Hodarchaeales archaeon]|jgi:hypothetical protein